MAEGARGRRVVATRAIAAAVLAAVLLRTPSPAPIASDGGAASDSTRADAPAPVVPDSVALASRPQGTARTSTGAEAEAAASTVVLGRFNYIATQDLVLVDAESGQALGGDLLNHIEWFGSQSGRVVARIAPGTGRWAESYPAELHESVEVTSTTMVVPLRRTIRVDVRVIDSRGTPVANAVVEQVHIGAHEIDGKAKTDARGAASVIDVPFFPGEPFWVLVDAPPRAIATGEFPTTWQPTVEVAVPLDEDHMAGRFETDRDLPTEESFGEALVKVPIRLVRLDGSPAEATKLRAFNRLWTTAQDGTLTLELPSSPTSVSVVDPSWTPTTVLLDAADGTQERVIREPKPASLDVVVEFADGRPVPFAHLTVRTPSGVGPLDLVDGVLRLDHFTGVDGRRTFTRVEPDDVSVHATWASRAAVERLRLLPGVRSSARLVLPDAVRVPVIELDLEEVEEVAELPR